MKETLLDIRSKLQNRVYTNEEHVRLSLVARILQELEWSIWDPKEVNTEFATRPEENKKKVDIALFLISRQPSVFIEVKALGKIDNNLREIERQLRDYAANMSSDFCIITDGCVWKFYYPLTRGEFRDKCFRTLDLLKDDIDEIEDTLQMFLGKSSIKSGEAKLKAKDLLKLTEVEKAMERRLPEARKIVQENPSISLADALVKLVKEEGYPISQEKSAGFILKIGKIGEKKITPVVGPPTSVPPGVIEIDPHNPESLSFTRNVEGQVGETKFRKWKGLVHKAVEKAWQHGSSLSELRRNCGIRVVEGNKTDEGFTPLPQLGISVGGYSANDSWKISFAIVQKFKMPIKVEFYWLEKEGAAYPGKKGILSWSP